MKNDNFPAMVGAFLLFLALIAISCLDHRGALLHPFQSADKELEFRTNWFRIFGYVDFNDCTATLDVYVNEAGQLTHDPVGTIDHCDGLTGADELPFGFTGEPWEESGLFRLTSPYLINDSFLDLWFPGCFPQDTWTGIEAVNVFQENNQWVMEVELEPAYQQCLADNKNAFYLRFDVEQKKMPIVVIPHETPTDNSIRK